MVASLVFLTPLGILAALAGAIPLAGLALAARREQQARRLLRLDPPPRTGNLRRAAALVAVPVLLGCAATQPALRSTKRAHVRTDVQAFFVLDISRSMLASQSPGSPTRLARAKQDALELRDAIPQVPAGVATITDRVIPDLFPNPGRNVFAQTLDQAVQIEVPPPISSNVLATSLDAIGSLGTQNFFDRTARRRVAVILTDGESVGIDNESVAHALETAPGVKLVFVHVWAPNEKVYDSGVAEQGYHTNPESGPALSELASAAGGHSFGEGSLGSAARALQADVGTGRTIVQGRTERTRTLAPYVALLALLPLLLVLPRIGRGLGSAVRVFGAGELQQVIAWKRHRSNYPRPRARVPAASEQGT
jgi:hypothetical protein